MILRSVGSFFRIFHKFLSRKCLVAEQARPNVDPREYVLGGRRVLLTVECSASL